MVILLTTGVEFGAGLFLLLMTFGDIGRELPLVFEPFTLIIFRNKLGLSKPTPGCERASFEDALEIFLEEAFDDPPMFGM